MRTITRMHLTLRHILSAAGLGLAAMLPATASELPIIAKARAFVATEATLSSLTSVRFIATLKIADPANPANTKSVPLDAVFEKPDRQLLKMTIDDRTEITGLDGYESWQLIQVGPDAKQRRLNILPPARTRRLLAETWENLYYYRGLEQRGGRVQDLGRHTIDGVSCHKIAFIHGPTVVFTRYFDVATGRLILTETEDGRAIREEGEMTVQGVRFPRVVTTISKDAKGASQTIVLTIERVDVNVPSPPRYFAVPTPTAP
ncbi:MAG: hypothetical protein JNL39_12370 [Opitutaceae bacterium]|nr:hypothetical protein [Opitutaceae bacterium]